MRVKFFHETSGEGISLISSNWNRGVVFFEITLFNFVDTVPRICSILPQIRSLSICQLHNGCDQQFHAKENKYRKAKLGKTKKTPKIMWIISIVFSIFVSLLLSLLLLLIIIIISVIIYIFLRRYSTARMISNNTAKTAVTSHYQRRRRKKKL